jgi:ABC-type tungstate transport system substrate-binding protein
MEDEAGNFDMGVAGSLTMILLSLAIVFLMVSFYRRYKRLIDRKDQE